MNLKHINAERVSGDVYRFVLSDSPGCGQTSWSGLLRIAEQWRYREIRVDLRRYHAADEPIIEVI